MKKECYYTYYEKKKKIFKNECSNGDIESLFYLRKPEFVLIISLDSENNFKEIIKTINEDSKVDSRSVVSSNKI